jgi:uncharacterized membrane protein YeaQ/YmgE (transglycosylase-associated protein family)
MERIQSRAGFITNFITNFILNVNHMGIILWIIFGGLVGWVASLIMKTDSSQGPFLNIVVGIVGGLIGGAIMSWLGAYPMNGFNLYSFVVALLGAIVLIGIVRAVRT